MTSTGLVLRADRDGLAILTLNRPDQLNSLGHALFETLDAHVNAIAADASIDAVILCGAGRCFSAGHDLNDIAAGVEVDPSYPAFVIERLATLAQPVIVAVHGHCYTGALELALAGDIILAADDARFADTHAKWALTPIWGMSQRLPRRIGRARAHEMMLTCRTVDAAEALSIGLANHVLPKENFLATAEQWVRTVMANSAFSHRANKRLLIETEAMSLEAGLAHEIATTQGVGPDMAARLTAFANRKRG